MLETATPHMQTGIVYIIYVTTCIYIQSPPYVIHIQCSTCSYMYSGLWCYLSFCRTHNNKMFIQLKLGIYNTMHSFPHYSFRCVLMMMLSQWPAQTSTTMSLFMKMCITSNQKRTALTCQQLSVICRMTRMESIQKVLVSVCTYVSIVSIPILILR